jgi:hypothetical protein
MRKHLQAALVLAGGVLAAPVAADFPAGVVLPSGVRPTEGALAQIDRHQTAVIWGNWHDLSPSEEPFTEVILVGRDGSSSKSRIAGIRGNRITSLGEERILIAGGCREPGAGEELVYGYRVYERRGSEWKAVWSSSDLPPEWRPGEEFPKFRVANEGTWAAIHVKRPRVLEFALGSFSDGKVDDTSTFEFSPEEISEGNRYFTDLEVEYLPTKKGSLFLISVDGKVWILDPSLGRRTSLTDITGRYARGVFDRERNLLWLTARGGWRAYDVGDFLGAKTRDPLAIEPRYELTDSAVGFAISNLHPGKDGLLVVGKSSKLEALRLEVGDESVVAPVSPKAMLLHPVVPDPSPQASAKWTVPELIPPLEFWPKVKPGESLTLAQKEEARKAARTALHRSIRGTALVVSPDGGTVAAIEGAVGSSSPGEVTLYRYDLAE